LLRLLLLAALAGCSDPDSPEEPGLDFDALPRAFPKAAPEQTFTARDGSALPFRFYDGGASQSLILVHGSGTHSLYLSVLAAAIAESGTADVYTPDLRGHGQNPARRGDIDYVEQLEDDVADLIAFVRTRKPDSAVLLGGHSSGAGLAVRVAGSVANDAVDGYLLLAPFLQHDAPTTRPRSGGWAHPKLGRIIPITLLNRIGIHAFDGATVLEFELPESRRSGSETLAYSWRLMTGFAPRDYRTDLRALCKPARVLVGADDEALVADRFEPVFAELAPHARVDVVPGVGHLDLVLASAARDAAISWLREFPSGQMATCVREPGRAVHGTSPAPAS
jgi:pimeloyl-ACP methyl ester carboxylesterase